MALVTPALLALLLVAAPGAARLQYQSRIPKGADVMRNGVAWPAVGHTASGSGGPRNPFGVAFANAGLSWTTALCEADSDGDGFSNGAELGDPGCQWAPGGTFALPPGPATHPGFADSHPDAAAGATPLPLNATNAPVYAVNGSNFSVMANGTALLGLCQRSGVGRSCFYNSTLDAPAGQHGRRHVHRHNRAAVRELRRHALLELW
jgi:hypothetical protein